MNKSTATNNYLIRRFCAYVIDILFVLLLSTLIAQINIINPNKDQYIEATDKYSELYKSTDNINDLTNNADYKDLTYQMAKYGVIYTLIDALVLIGYFVVFQKSTNGQTIGKKLMRVQIVSGNGSKVKFWQLLLRSLFLYSIVSDLVCSGSVLYFDQSIYYNINMVVTNVFRLLFYVSIAMVFFRTDSKGLHDLVAKTKVIDLKENSVLEQPIIEKPKKDVKEEKVVNAKVKSVKKKKTTK